MRTITLCLAAALAAIFAGTALAADPYRIDQRDPKYQVSLNIFHGHHKRSHSQEKNFLKPMRHTNFRASTSSKCSDN